MKIFLQNFKTQAALLFLMMVCLGGSAYGQTLNHYRSLSGGNWSTHGNWERGNGTIWETCTGVAPLAYPGSTGTTPATVFISNGHSMTLDVSPPVALGRFELTAGVAPTSLTFGATRVLTVTGAVISEESGGNNTITVGDGTLNCQQMRLTNLSGGDVAKITISTGIVRCNQGTPGSVQLQNGLFEFTGNGSLTLAGATASIVLTGAAPAFTTFAGCTVTFSGTGAQTIPAIAYQNLAIATSGVKTIAAGATIAGALTISGTAQAALNTGTNYVVSTLATTLNTSTGGGGTWGSTTSAATNIDNTSFTATTGTITVNGVLGDIRSAVSTGNWSAPTTWQRYDGSAWVACTGVTPLGYPGQFTLAQRVFIRNGHAITLDATPPNPSSITRLEFPSSSATGSSSLTFATGADLVLPTNCPIVMEESNANNTISVGTSSLTCPQIRLTNSTGAAEISEINVSTGSVTITSTTAGIQLNGTTAKSIFRFTDSGTLSINQGITGGGAFIASTSTVTFGNFGIQTVPAYAFNNLTLSGSGIKTISASTIINNNITISTGVIASLNAGTTYNVSSLILGTTGGAQGTWGNTASAPVTNINDTFFAATTGKLNVGLSTPDITPTIGTYTYTGLSQGPNTATNTGTGTSYTFSYRNNGGTVYGPSATPPTNAGNYFVTATVAADGVFRARTSAATPFIIAIRNLFITANDDTKLVGLTYTVGSNSTAFTSFGLQNGETIGTITTASTGAPSGVAVGTYPIVPSAATGGTFSAANYNIGYTSGTLTVSDANTGDYRSIVSGVWTNVNTWESWNGTAWVTPPATYPSQTTGTGVVYISDGHAVSSGSIFVSDANRASRIELSSGTAASSLTIDGTSTLGASGGIRIRPSSLAGVTRTINIGNGRLNGGNILIEDTGSDGIDSEIVIGTGTLYLGNGNCAMGGSSLRNAIRFTGSGTLQLDGNSGRIIGGTLVAGSGRVTFSDSAAQVVGGYAFNNLTLTDAGTKTLNAAATIAGNLTISGTAKALLPTGANIPVNSLILGSNGKLLGIWGSTTSSPTPTYNDNIYFETNASAGILTVAKSTSDVIVTVGTYIYTGVAQGPNTATNAPGTGTSYTFSYVGVSPTVYPTSATPPTIVGTYSVTATVAANGDFVANSSAATAFAITRRDLIITANDGVKVYGDTFVVGAGSTAFTSTGLQAGQTIGTITTASLGAVSSAIVGTYAIVPTAAIGGTFAASNYTITYSDGTLTVNPRIGDYRTVASGNWNVLTTWERWNGTAWATPTTGQGYPGQIETLRVVYIQPTHNINGNVTIGDPNPRLRDLIFLNGPGDSSLSIIGGNSIQVNNVVRVLSGANRTINVGVGFLSVGAFDFSDTGSDSVDSKLTIDTGSVFVSGSLVMQGSSNRNAVEFTGSGSLQFISNGTMTGGALISATGTVHYNGTANQTVGTYGYTNLVLGNGGIKTVTATTTISSNLTIRDAASASLNAGTIYNIGTLTLGCLGRENGSWGSSGPDPDPTYVDDIYFQNTTGFINVATNTRPIPVTTQTQPTCIVGGIITVTPVADATSYTVTGTSPVVAAVTNSTGVFSGLAGGTYSVYFTNPCGTSITVTSITISELETKTWNGTAWSPIGAPTANENIVFTASYAENTDVTACACTVNSGTVNFPAGRYLKLGGRLTVNSPGTLTFENNSSLVQTTFTGSNIGNITYKRANTTFVENDYTYWSSPVALQNLFAVSPLTKADKFYSFNPGANDWVQESPSSTTMIIGKGYIIRGIPQPAPPDPPGFHTASFVGVPNNGDQSITVSGGETSNLIGNPYPSAIDADTFLAANAAAIDGTIYFWTHNTAIQDRNLIAVDLVTGLTTAGSGALAYTSNDYALYNGTGGVAISGGVVPTGKIAAGQSFFSTSTNLGGTVNFTNAMRVDGSGNSLDNSNFYKTKNQKLKSATAIEKNRVWLNLSNNQGAFKQTLVGYITNATNEYDSRFDGESYDGNNFIDFYSVNSNKNLTIQGRALPFDENDEVILGYRTTINGKFTININQLDGLLINKAIFIEDKLANTIFDLKGGNYTFNTDAGTFDNRFVLRYINKTLGIEKVENNDEISVLYSNNLKSLFIRNYVKDTVVNSVTLYNILGQKLSNWDVKDKEQTNIQIPINNLPAEIYIVKIKTNLGESSKKIILK
jgi:hypothetical protein